MSYTRLVRFSTVDLPELDPKWDPGTAPAVDRTLRTAGGFHDADGTGRAEAALPYERSYACVVTETDAVTLRATVTALRGLSRKRAKLWREQVDDGDREWCWARLLTVPMEQATYLAQAVELRFLILSPWQGVRHSSGWVLDDGEVLDDGLYLDETGKYTLSSSPKAITLANGDAPVRDVTITITAGGAAITALTVANATASCKWAYTGTIASGKKLIMQAGIKALKNDGVDAYGADFALDGAAHLSPWWFELAPGNNAVTVTFTGGSTDSTITFEYCEGQE